MAKIKRVGPSTQTVRAQHARMKDAFVPGWDKRAGMAQALDRVAPRAAMGNKMTPKGNARLKKD